MKVFAYDIEKKVAFFPNITSQLGGNTCKLFIHNATVYEVVNILLRPNHKLHVVHVKRHI